jgi:Nucleotidyl transferase AbiEii toxin, Type IV TA system
MSRHLYDWEKLMDTEYAVTALANRDLYQQIVEHRKTITPLRGIDYGNHAPEKINHLPPENFMTAWKNDYEQMRQSMIYRESISFDNLLVRMIELKRRVSAWRH